MTEPLTDGYRDSSTDKASAQINLGEITPGKAGHYSFLNLYSIRLVADHTEDFASVQFAIDGWMLVALVRLLTHRDITRLSFDDTSLAPQVFELADHETSSISVWGGTREQAQEFGRILKAQYPHAILHSTHGGYADEESNRLFVSELKQNPPDILLVGRGSPLQEMTIQQVASQVNIDLVYSCGGYIRQKVAARGGNYYPSIFRHALLRGLFRMYKEKHTVKRYLYHYPRNVFWLIREVRSGRLKLNFL
jgi:exopolysaccharide biosynthesis WecB/TagA/CpsF family protein